VGFLVGCDSPNQEGVETTDSEEVWILTDPSMILVICTSLRKWSLFFLLKEAHFYACSLLFSSSLRIAWEKRASPREVPTTEKKVTDIPIVLDTITSARRAGLLAITSYLPTARR